MGTALVIVESPAKARTIEKYLGDGFRVEASVGHIRDLPRSAAEIPPEIKKQAWSRLGVNVEQGFEPLYIVPVEKKQQVKKLKEALAEARELYLATDEDREGESISWHLMEVLKPRVPVKRLVFHEITKAAIQKALQSARAVDLNLVRAQETRRIVDRLYGYEVSPLLWKKVRPQLSAGRVQSVAVRLVVERERQRMDFRSASWWDVTGTFRSRHGELTAALTAWDGLKLASGKDFDDRGRLKGGARLQHLDEAGARAAVAELQGRSAQVSEVGEKPYTDRPAAPFTTSTLQQEGVRKLRWSARRTMQVAQHLYETGWITYMRTDSTTLSDEAVGACRKLIRDQYGADYLPSKPRVYVSKVKNAQEAHEAIRPAGSTFRSLEAAESELKEDEARLYALIWRRTVACQMEDARGKLIDVAILAGKGEFHARGKTIEFPGFRRAYVEGSDNPEAELAEQERILPPVRKGDGLDIQQLLPKGHETQPPARLTEATLVKELEARGIGRPSTYASIIDTILQRGYVFKKGSALAPTYTAFAVTGLLETHLSWLVDYDFTARMEQELDDIAEGKADSEGYLSRFYLGEAGMRDRLVAAEGHIDPRQVCTFPVATLEDGRQVDVRVGRYGPFLSAGEQRAEVPGDLAPDELTAEKVAELLAARAEGPRVLGAHPESGQPVMLMNGRFGPYVQLGEVVEGSKTKPPRASLLQGMAPDELDLETALQLLALPRDLGTHPESGEQVVASNGRFGPYLKCGETTRSIPLPRQVLSISLEEAVEILKQPSTRRRGGSSASAGRQVGVDSSTGRPVRLLDGRYGPYVTDGVTNASLRKDQDPEKLDLSAALELIRAREGVAPSRPGRKPARGAVTRAPAKKKAVEPAVAATEPATPEAPRKASATKAPPKEAAAPKKAAPKKAAPKKAAPKKAAPGPAGAAEAPAEGSPGKARARKKKEG